MAVYFDRTMSKAKKSYPCDACHWIDEGWNRADLNMMTFAEKRSYLKAKANGFNIVKGQTYLRQNQIYDGRFVTFRGIPEMNDICHKYELYPDPSDY